MYEDDDDWDEDDWDDDDWDEDDDENETPSEGLAPKRKRGPVNDYRVNKPGPWKRDIDSIEHQHRPPSRTFRDQHGNPVPESAITGLAISPQQFTEWRQGPAGVLYSRTEAADFGSDEDFYSASVMPFKNTGRVDVTVHHGTSGIPVAVMGANRAEMGKLLAQAAVNRHARGADMETGRILRQGVKRTVLSADRSEISRLNPILRSVVSQNRQLVGLSAPTEEELNSLIQGVSSGKEKIDTLNARIDATVRSNTLLHAGTLGVDIEDWADPEPSSVQVPEAVVRGGPARKREREERAYNRAARSAAFHGVTRMYFD